MLLGNTSARWGTLARFLHWLIAFLILGLFVVGLIMEDLPGDSRKLVYALHKSFGLFVLALVLLRILWRLTNRAPAEIESIPLHMKLAAKAGHLGLYALMIAVPLSGWIMHSLSGYTTNWFGQAGLPLLPTLTEKTANRELVHDMGEIHELAAYAIIALVVVHAGAALYHHFIRKDATLARMTPFVKDPK
jgi:cytochrome b561